MASTGATNIIESSVNNTEDIPLRSIIETPLTEALINELFQQQNNDGSFPLTEKFGKLFNVDFDVIKRQLKDKGLESSISDGVHRLISTASVLFYFLYHSQKAKFPVDMATINQIVSKARSDLESLSLKDEPTVQAYVDKGEMAVKFVLDARDKYTKACENLKLPQKTWESYIQHLMGLDK